MAPAQCAEYTAASNPANISISQVNDTGAAVASNSTTTLTATVTYNKTPVTVGTVTFCNQGAVLGTAHVNSSGIATLNVAFPPGSFLIVAHYSGSAQAGPGFSNPPTAVEVAGSDNITLASSGSSSGYTLTATLTSNLSDGPDGSVSFIDQTTGETLGTAAFTNQVTTSDVAMTPMLGDFTGSGTKDTVQSIFVGGSAGVNGNAAFQVNITNLNGTTSQVVSEPFGQTSDSYEILLVGDFNNDGIADIVVQDTNTDAVTVLLSQGNGQFSIGGQLTIPPVTAAVAGDFNNDGNLDLIAATANGMAFYAGDGAGNLAAGEAIDTAAKAPALVSDYLTNGNLDFFSYTPDLFAGTTPIATDFDGTTLNLGSGNGTSFTGQTQAATFGNQAPPSAVLSMVTANWFNPSTCPGLAYATATTVTMMSSNCSGSFAVESETVPDTGQTYTAQYNIGSHANVQLAVADVNGDGLPDVIAFIQDDIERQPAPWNMIVFLNSIGGFPFGMSAEAQPDSSGTNFPNPPVPFTTPILGEPLAYEYEAGVPFLSSGTSSTGTATLSNVTLPAGSHTIVASYAGNDGTPGATSNTVALSGSADGYEGPSIDTLSTDNYTSSARVSNGVLTLTDGGTWEEGSAWTPNPVNVQSFATTFTFQLTNAQADGFTFTVQNDPYYPDPVGFYGGNLGYSGNAPGSEPPSKLYGPITPSVALKFDLYDNAGEGNDSTGVYTDGAAPTMPANDMTPSGVNLHSGDVMQAQVIYDGANLWLTLTDTVTGAVFHGNWPVNIPQIVGGTTAYVGFTGSTGGLTATQQILSWTYTPLPFYPDFSNGPTPLMTGGAAVEGTSNPALIILNGGYFTADSAWFPTPVPINQFTTDFTFTGSDVVADGFTFTIQNAGPNAVGPAGGGLGYGPDTPGEPVGITNSMAIKFDFYNNQGEGSDSTGIYTGGDSPTMPAIDLSDTGINLHSADPINVHMVYDGSTITMTMLDVQTKATWTHYFYGVTIPQLVGGSSAYVGFTAGTGGLTSYENINGWTYLPSNTITSPVKTY